jgi:hypothetical protein
MHADKLTRDCGNDDGNNINLSVDSAACKTVLQGLTEVEEFFGDKQCANATDEKSPVD